MNTANLDQNAVLAEIGKIITSSLKIEDVYDQFAELTGTILPHDVISINLVDWERELYTIAYRHGPEITNREIGNTLPLAGSMAQRVSKSPSGALIDLSDVEFVHENIPGSLPFTANGFISSVGVPLKSNGVVHSILIFNTRNPAGYDGEHLLLAQKIGAQIAGAIANAQLHLRLSRSATEQDILANIFRAMTSSLDIDEVYAEFGELIRPIIPFDRIAIWEFDESEPSGGVIHALGDDILNLGHGMPPPTSTSKFYDVISNRSTLLVSDESKDENQQSGRVTSLAIAAGFRSLLAVPLIAHDQVIGTLVFRSRTPRMYTHHHKSVAQRISSQISGLLAIKQLHRISEREGYERRVLAEISRVISSSIRISDVYEQFSELTSKLIEFDRISIGLIGRDDELLPAICSQGLEIEEIDRGPSSEPASIPLTGLLANEVLLTKSTITVHEPDRSSLERSFPGLLDGFDVGLRSWLAVPLITEGSVIGVLMMSSMTSEYSRLNIEIAERIAAQIVGTVANAKLHEDLTRESAERLALAEISRIVSSEVDLDKIFDRFACELQKIIKFDKAAITILDLEENTLTYAFRTGPIAPDRSLNGPYPLDGSLTLEMLSMGKGTAIDLRDEDWLSSHFPGLIPIYRLGVRSMLSTPLVSEGVVFGALMISSFEANSFGSHDLDFVERVGNQIAGALANSKLRVELEREASDRKALAELGRIMSSSPNIEDVYDEFADKVKRVIPFDRIVIATVDQEAWTSTVAYVTGLDVASMKPGDSIPLSNTHVEEAIKSRSAAILRPPDVQQMRERYQHSHYLLDAGLQSFLSVPLISSDKVTGVLMLRSLEPNAYAERELDLAERVAHQIAGAISNAQMYASQEREAHEKEVLAEIGRIIGSSLNIDDVYERFAAEVGKIAEFDSIIINAIDLDRETLTPLYTSGIQVPGREPGEVVPLKGTPSYEVAISNGPILVDTELDPDAVERFPIIEEESKIGFRSSLLVPLVSNDEIIGTLGILSKQSCAYGMNDVALLQRIGSQIAGAIASSMLYTELIDTSTALNESQEQWDSLARNSPDIITILDLEGIIQYINRTVDGRDISLMRGKSIFDFVSDPFHDTVAAALSHVLTYGSPSSYEIDSIPGLDQALTFDSRVGPIKQAGKIIALSVISTDITERKQAEQALIESEGRTRAIFDGAGIGICLLEASGNLITVNPSLMDIVGYTEKEILSVGFLGMMNPNDIEACAKLYREWLNGDRDRFDHEVRLVNKGGHTIWARITLTLHHIDSQSEPLLIAMIEDITQRRQLEEQLLQSQKMEAVGQLAGGVAHDFNNLLTAIIGFAHLGSFRVHEDHPVYRYFRDIQSAGERAARLTRQLLTFSHNDITEPVSLDLNEVIAEVNRMLRRVIGENIELSTLLAPDLGQITIDATHVEQLLVNLTVNASDAMPDGGKLWIETNRQTISENSMLAQGDMSAGDYVVLTVRDTGIGMTDDVKSKIFEPFFTTKEVGKGTGLGLATCYGIATKAGGHIEVETQLEKGTSFHVYFPMDVDSSGPSDSRGESREQDVAEGHETILLVEDEALVREVCAIALRRQGYKVLEASNGTEAVRIVEEHIESGIDLLLTDVVMPFMGGVELSERIVASIPAVKVLFASGYSDDQTLSDVLDTKNHHFIQKPFTPQVLANSVREILDS